MTTAQLNMCWIPVADASGRTRLEAVWVTASLAPAERPVAASHQAA